MRFLSHSHKEKRFSSVVWHESRVQPGVRYAIRRISLAQRIDLTARVRDLMLRHEFLTAGEASDQLEASLAELLTRRLYIEWGLAEIQDLAIDGEPATVQSVVEKGPQSLADEIAGQIRAEMGLSEEERKNS